MKECYININFYIRNENSPRYNFRCIKCIRCLDAICLLNSPAICLLNTNITLFSRSEEYLPRYDHLYELPL